MEGQDVTTIVFVSVKFSLTHSVFSFILFLFWQRYVFQLSEREKTNKLFHLQFNIASNKYVRVSDSDWEIDGWQTAVYESKNMFRKEEHDWKMASILLTCF